MLIKLSICFLITICSQIKGQRIEDADRSLNAPEIIQKNGYPVEIHSVTTHDGYVLTLHRIPHGKHLYGSLRKKVPALLMHGYFRSSIDWVMTDPNQNLAFLLANTGYDVWLGNIRGGIYTLNHTFLDAHSEKFWNFTVDDISFNDIPAMVDYVLKLSQSKDLFYVGYSACANYYFNLGTSLPEYNSKVRAMVALGPVTQAHEFQAKFLPIVRYILILKARIGSNLIKVPNLLLNYLGRHFCSYKGFPNNLCTNLYYLAVGKSDGHFNSTVLPQLLEHLSSIPTRLSIQLLDLLISGKMVRDDLGTIGNLMKYGQLTPPEYDLSLLTTPTYMLFGANDPYTRNTEIQVLLEQIPASIGKKKIDGYMHLDYLYAKDILENVNSRILSVFELFS